MELDAIAGAVLHATMELNAITVAVMYAAMKLDALGKTVDVCCNRVS